jgi:predicted nucleic acid-binding protein
VTTRAVLDASVVLKWFAGGDERHAELARSVGDAFESGRLTALAPPLLRTEVLNVAGRAWGWRERPLIDLAEQLDEMAFAYLEPELADVARWTARGLTAYDATYVALAEAEAVPLVTDDDLIVSLAPGIAMPLASWDD